MISEYMFITFAEWEADYIADFPNARANKSNTEVVLTCDPSIGTHNRDQAAQHIIDNWDINSEIDGI